MPFSAFCSLLCLLYTLAQSEVFYMSGESRAWGLSFCDTFNTLELFLLLLHVINATLPCGIYSHLDGRRALHNDLLFDTGNLNPLKLKICNQTIFRLANKFGLFASSTMQSALEILAQLVNIDFWSTVAI